MNIALVHSIGFMSGVTSALGSCFSSLSSGFMKTRKLVSLFQNDRQGRRPLPEPGSDSPGYTLGRVQHALC